MDKKYIDGFVLAVPKEKLDSYREMAQKMAKLMKKYGALKYIEAVGEDMNPKMMEGMEIAKFPQMVQARPDEVVMFSFIVFESRAHRDEVNARVMKDPFLNDSEMKEKMMPFDMKRMAYGGFEVIVES
ncbi:MAG TPA: DUF1428 domain-containing protein [Candidatus Moranbacteria bacterium]|jgi:uncharacterized protein YbaA (DUF1428 family)|nr:DUF1428 domain-containing protein [Candidatus Moranbacteria bacterium]HOF42552.1 DUF1428 domain-containing protein [Candidatus Moranbacteria bacterium]HPX94769.1 DUF1428 domain-containing protein [Candidatus Moranbacteria bacterium]HQB59611.1 DUF1428 domain-containing protein [Candidatus Moranbacteria bacterium]